jgi:anthranilate phosphoribosyltransferase
MMQNPRQVLEHLLERRDLSEIEAAALLELLTANDLAPAMAGALLSALRAKGVTAAEVRGFAGAMRALARKPAFPASPDAIDIVGTGGDSSGSLNLSTGAALLAAACGLPVVKHGNRSVTSRSGSADFIEQLGFTLPLDEHRAAQCFAATGFTFLFAPYFHPAMKALAPIRAALKVRTVFNLLGPLTNPAAPRFYLIGAYDEATAELMAHTLSGMQIERAWIVHGAAGWDEATPIGPFVAFDVTRGGISRRRIDPKEFGLPPCESADLKGGDAAENLSALHAVFESRDRGAHRAALALQCGLALYIAGRSASIAAGIAEAAAAIDSGQARQWLQGLQRFAAGQPPA